MPHETPAATAVAVRELVGVEFFGGGDTVAVRFATADGQIVGVLFARKGVC